MCTSCMLNTATADCGQPTDGKQCWQRLASMSSQTITRLGSVKSSSSTSPRRGSSNVGAGAGNNDVEIFVQNTK